MVETRMGPKRSAALDAVRLVGTFAVVAGHVWTEPFALKFLYTWHVPVFFVLSGYLWTQGRSLRQEFVSRSRSLLLPYATWLIIISAFAVPLQLAVGSQSLVGSLRALGLGGAYIGQPYSAFWFVTALFVAAVAFRTLEVAPLWVGTSIAGASLILAYAFPGLLARVPESIGVALACLVFVYAGSGLKAMRMRIKHGVAVGALLIASSVCLVVAGLVAPLDLKYGYFGTIGLSVLVAIAISVGLVLVAEGLVPLMGRRIENAISVLASCGFFVILTHAVILWCARDLGWPHLVVFAFALIVPWMAAIGLRKSKLAPALLGLRVPVGSLPRHRRSER